MAEVRYAVSIKLNISTACSSAKDLHALASLSGDDLGSSQAA
jgi:hypothetical protein